MAKELYVLDILIFNGLYRFFLSAFKFNQKLKMGNKHPYFIKLTCLCVVCVHLSLRQICVASLRKEWGEAFLVSSCVI